MSDTNTNLTIRGSHGDLVIDRAGTVISELSTFYGEEYRSIDRFDLAEYSKTFGGTDDDLLTMNGETDINDLAYWWVDDAGVEHYEPAFRGE